MTGYDRRAFRLRRLGPSPRLRAAFRGVCAGMLLGFLLKGVAGRHHHRRTGRPGRGPVHPPHDLSWPARRVRLRAGAASADAVFGIIAGFGLTFVSDLLLGYQDWLRLGGAGFLLYIGISAFTADPLRRHAVAARSRGASRRLRLGLRADHHQPDNDPRLCRDLRRDRLCRPGGDAGTGGDPRSGRVARLAFVVGRDWPSAPGWCGCRSTAIIWSGSTAARAGYWCFPGSRCSAACWSQHFG